MRNRQDPDTDIGGPLRNFPETNHSVIAAVCSDEPHVRQRALESIIETYWKPVYKFIRIKWGVSNESAKDLTQGFFANAFEKDHLANYDVRKASFQTFIRTCVEGFVANTLKAEQRLKRGGGLAHLSLDFEGAENELLQHPPSPTLSPEEYFEREWTRNLFRVSIETLRSDYQQSGRTTRFRLFERYDLEEVPDKVSYASLAKEFGLTTTTVTNQLAAARRDFRRVLLSKLRELTGTDEEFRKEARELLGIEMK